MQELLLVETFRVVVVWVPVVVAEYVRVIARGVARLNGRVTVRGADNASLTNYNAGGLGRIEGLGNDVVEVFVISRAHNHRRANLFRGLLDHLCRILGRS